MGISKSVDNTSIRSGAAMAGSDSSSAVLVTVYSNEPPPCGASPARYGHALQIPNPAEPGWAYGEVKTFDAAFSLRSFFPSTPVWMVTVILNGTVVVGRSACASRRMCVRCG